MDETTFDEGHRPLGLQEFVLGDGFFLSFAWMCECGIAALVASRRREVAFTFYAAAQGGHTSLHALFLAKYRQGGNTLTSAGAAAAAVARIYKLSREGVPMAWVPAHDESQA